MKSLKQFILESLDKPTKLSENMDMNESENLVSWKNVKVGDFVKHNPRQALSSLGYRKVVNITKEGRNTAFHYEDGRKLHYGGNEKVLIKQGQS